ncbi:Nucleolar protein 13, variant 2 [Entomophthora muscae]|nr:Nucleolar protein 13, variant 2 [Entomophthora muscae]
MEGQTEEGKILSKKEARKEKKRLKELASIKKEDSTTISVNDKEGNNEKSELKRKKEATVEKASKNKKTKVSADETFDFLEAGFKFAPVEPKDASAPMEDDGLVVIEPKINKVKLTVDDITEIDRKNALKEKLRQEMKSRSQHCVWIGNLRYTTTEDDLKRFFASCGNVTRINLPVTNSRNKGFAYVDFDSPDAVARALDLSESSLEGRNVLIKDSKNHKKDGQKPPAPKALPNEAQMAPMPTLYVGNLSFHTGKEDLQAAFSKYGEIRKVRISTFEDTGRCKG